MVFEKRGGGSTVMPSFASSSAIAPNSVSAFRSFTRASIISTRRSGRRSKRFFGEIWPIITASVTPRV
jgi:hypothetical protein